MLPNPFNLLGLGTDLQTPYQQQQQQPGVSPLVPSQHGQQDAASKPNMSPVVNLGVPGSSSSVQKTVSSEAANQAPSSQSQTAPQGKTVPTGSASVGLQSHQGLPLYHPAGPQQSGASELYFSYPSSSTMPTVTHQHPPSDIVYYSQPAQQLPVDDPGQSGMFNPVYRVEDTVQSQYKPQQQQQQQNQQNQQHHQQQQYYTSYVSGIPYYMRPQLQSPAKTPPYGTTLTSFLYPQLVPGTQPPSAQAGTSTVPLSMIPASQQPMLQAQHQQYPSMSMGVVPPPPLGSYAAGGMGAEMSMLLQNMQPIPPGAHYQPAHQLNRSMSQWGASSTRTKRTRRKRNEVERLYFCNYQDCTKGYGSLSHLNGHIVKHGHGKRRHPEEFFELRKYLKERDERNRQ